MGADELRARRKRFVEALAAYVTADAAKQGILLSMGDKGAERWAAVRSAAGVMGWVGAKEAEWQICAFLGMDVGLLE